MLGSILLSVSEYDVQLLRHHTKRPLSGTQVHTTAHLPQSPRPPLLSSRDSRWWVKSGKIYRRSEGRISAFIAHLRGDLLIDKQTTLNTTKVATYISRSVSVPWIISSHTVGHSYSAYMCVCIYRVFQKE